MHIPSLKVWFCLLCLLIAIPSVIQAQCTQKLSELPAAQELLGFRLGMTRVEIKSRVPQVVFGRTDHFGVSKTTINPQFDSRIDPTKFEGVRSISLELLDERLISLWIGYDENFKTKTVEEFVKAISTSLKLNGSWTSWKIKGQQLKCADFQLYVSTIAASLSLRVVDTGAEELIGERRRIKEEEDSAAEALASEEESTDIVADKHTKLYYSTKCQSGKDIAVPNRIVFKSAEEAEKAGYKLAKECKQIE